MLLYSSCLIGQSCRQWPNHVGESIANLKTVEELLCICNPEGVHQDLSVLVPRNFPAPRQSHFCLRDYLLLRKEMLKHRSNLQCAVQSQMIIHLFLGMYSKEGKDT
jgi:hypothetical protein